MALRPCSECKRWIYDAQGNIEVRRGRKVPNTSGRTPCSTCPKESPEKASQYELTAQNMAAVHFYYTTRAMRGANLSERMKTDAILQRNFAIIEQVVRPLEARQAITSAIESVLPQILPALPGFATRRAS